MQTNQPKRRDDVLTQESGDEIMLYDTATDEMHILNPTAQFIWGLCDGEHSTEQICTALKAEFVVDAATDVMGDIEQTLAEFGAKNLLQINAV